MNFFLTEMSNTKTKLIQKSNILLENRYLNEKASDLRSYMNKTGWKEKESELSSGGDITDELTDVINKLMYSATSVECKGTFTSGNDKFHKNRKSRHNQGQAVDVVMDSNCHPKFIELLNQFVKLYPGFSYIDEYKNPSKGATGGHFHISYSKGNPETGSSGDIDSSNASASDNSSTSGITGSDDQHLGAKIMKDILTGGHSSI